MRQGVQAGHPTSLTQGSESQAAGPCTQPSPAETLRTGPARAAAAGPDSDQPSCLERDRTLPNATVPTETA